MAFKDILCEKANNIYRVLHDKMYKFRLFFPNNPEFILLKTKYLKLY